MRVMKRLVGVLVCTVLISVPAAQAQMEIVEAVKAAAKKIIKAVDLKVQRLQNQTIWLQNAQKEIENTLSKLKLQEIGDWVEKQRKLYDDYFQELYQVKTAIVSYHRVKMIMQEQAWIVQEYKRAYALFRQDEHFSANEMAYMGEVYAGILEESVRHLDQLQLVVTAFTTQMSDAKRLEIIDEAASNIEANYHALLRFNNQNQLLSLSRARDLDEARMIRAMYGL
jgi:hypothetical protein